MKLLHKSAVFDLQPEDQSRHYPGRYRQDLGLPATLFSNRA